MLTKERDSIVFMRCDGISRKIEIARFPDGAFDIVRVDVLAQKMGRNQPIESAFA